MLDVDHKEDDDELFAAELIKRSHNMFRATQLLGLGFSSAGAFVTHTHSAEAEQEESIQEDVCLIYFRYVAVKTLIKFFGINLYLTD